MWVEKVFGDFLPNVLEWWFLTEILRDGRLIENGSILPWHKPTGEGLREVLQLPTRAWYLWWTKCLGIISCPSIQCFSSCCLKFKTYFFYRRNICSSLYHSYVLSKTDHALKTDYWLSSLITREEEKKLPPLWLVDRLYTLQPFLIIEKYGFRTQIRRE